MFTPNAPYPIIGGGIAGLSTALALAHHGAASIVHEQAATFAQVGAGIQLSPNAMAVLDRLGLGDSLARAAVAPQSIELRDGRTDGLLANIPLGELAGARYGAPYLVIHRADLHGILVEACANSPLIEIQLGSTLAPHDSDAVMIAADGVHSRWRGSLAGTHAKQFTGYVAWRCMHPLSTSETHPRTHVWFGPKAHLVDYPIRSGQARNMVAIAQTRDSDQVVDDPGAALQTAFSAWHPVIRARLGEQATWTPWPLYSVDPQGSWGNARVALVGDAAHAMLPFAAQGGAMAIEDAWVLAQTLTSMPNTNQAVSRYQMARKVRVTRVWKQAETNGKIYHLTGPLALARNAVLRARSGEGLLAGFDWLYGWKPGQT